MRRKTIIFIVALLALTALFAFAACDGGNDIAVTGVTITGTGVNNGKLSLMTGGRDVLLKAAVRPNNATIKTVVWTSENENVVTVSQEGTLKIVGAGVTKVKAAVKDKSDSIEVTVTARQPVTSVSFPSESYVLTINKEQGGKLDLGSEVSVLPENASNKTVIWSIAPNDASVVIDAQGVIIAGANVDLTKTFTVTATSVSDNNVKGETTVTLGKLLATNISVRLASFGAAKKADYVYEFSLDDARFEHLFFVAEPDKPGAFGEVEFLSDDESICDIIAVDSNNAYIDIKAEGETTIRVTFGEGSDVIEVSVKIKINPPAGYILDDLNVLADEIQTNADNSGWWDFEANPNPKPETPWYCVQENQRGLGMFYADLDGTGWNAKLMPNQGNGAYIEDGGWCTVFTLWDWPEDNEQTNGYVFNKVHVPAEATTFRMQARTMSDVSKSGKAKFRVRFVDGNDFTKQIFLDVNGQNLEGFQNLENRDKNDCAEYPDGTFNAANGWIIIPRVADYNKGEDIYFMTIPAEWKNKDVVVFIEVDDIYQDDGFGHSVTGKCDIFDLIRMGFVSLLNDVTEFVPAETTPEAANETVITLAALIPETVNGRKIKF